MKKLINIVGGITMLTLLFGALTGCVESVGDPFEPSSSGNNNMSLYLNGDPMRQTTRNLTGIYAAYYENLDTLEIYSPLAYVDDEHKLASAAVIIIIPSPKNIHTAEKNAVLLFNLYPPIGEIVISESSLTIDSFNFKNGGYISGTFRLSGVVEGEPIEVTNGLFDIKLRFYNVKFTTYGWRLKH